MKASTPTRFRRDYRTVAVRPQSGAFVVRLDERALKTTAGADLAAPTWALANSIADEWANAGDPVDLAAMPFTRLAFAAIDRGPIDRVKWREDILAFLRSDLLCYRAAGPIALVRRQNEVWSPFLEWAREATGVALLTTAGLAAVSQPDAAMAALSAYVARLDDWTLIAVRRASEVAGSGVLALALEAGAFAPEVIFAAARLDERFQRERWGVDEEAAAREAAIESEFISLARFLAVIKQSVDR